MHFQKRKLLERIRQVRPERKGMVKTIPKRGFVLDLAATEMELRYTENSRLRPREEGLLAALPVA